MAKLSESEEEYLESLYRLGGKEKQVRVGKLAKDLGVKEPSVVEMLKKLESKNFLKYESYAGAKLTEKGENEGMQVTRKHRLAERLLSDVLDRELPKIHEEACKLEHSIEDDTADAIAKVLGNPETCPHGRPIPGKNSETKQEDFMKLSEGEEGEEYEVVSIPEEEENIKRLLPLAILPGSKVKITERPRLSALMIKRGNDTLALSQDIASEIKVKPHGKKRKRRHHGRSSR